MIFLGSTRGVYRVAFVPRLIHHRALGLLAARGLHDPIVDKHAFHRLHWAYLREQGLVLSRGHARYYRAHLKEGLLLFNVKEEDLW